MANHDHVVTKKHATPDRLNDALVKITRDRFESLIVVDRVDDAYWNVRSEDSRYHFLTLWTTTRQRIEMRKNYGGTFSHWIRAIIQNDLAIVFNGKCGNEGSHLTWKPTENVYPTFLSFWDMLNDADRYDVTPESLDEIKTFWKTEYVHVFDQLPLEFRRFS